MRISGLLLIFVIFGAGTWQLSAQNVGNAFDQVILNDNFGGYGLGLLSPPVGPHTEYHFLKEVQPKGKWRITSFYHNPRGADTAWRIESFKGEYAMCQTINNKNIFTHPMVMAGDNRWRDYVATVYMTPRVINSRAGLIFRYHNDRQYYFFGMEKSEILLMAVNYETAFHSPRE